MRNRRIARNVAGMDHAALMDTVYRAFNERDVDTAVAHMTEDVDWPNAWEGGRAHGRDGVREYWTRQWAAIDSSVEPRAVRVREDASVEVSVHQVVRGLDGTITAEGDVRHVYVLRDGLVARMDVEE
jgi:hypothetical protein